MATNHIAREYKRISKEDQRTFDNWLKANGILGLIFAAGLLAMAVAGANSVGPLDAVASQKASNIVASE
jgi:hypothetical protein